MNDATLFGVPVGQLINESMLADNGLEPGVVMPVSRPPAPAPEQRAVPAPESEPSQEDGEPPASAVAPGEVAEVPLPDAQPGRDLSEIVDPEPAARQAVDDVPMPAVEAREFVEVEGPATGLVDAPDVPEVAAGANLPQPEIVDPVVHEPRDLVVESPQRQTSQQVEVQGPESQGIGSVEVPTPEPQSRDFELPPPPEPVADDTDAADLVPLPMMQELMPASFPVVEHEYRPQAEGTVEEVDLPDVVWELPKDFQWSEVPFRDGIAMDADETVAGQSVSNDRGLGDY